MHVNRNFEKIYNEEQDPWSIGAADNDRYTYYFHLFRAYLDSRRALIDIGCGFGAFLARFRRDFEHLIGIEVSLTAIQKGQQRYPFIQFIQGAAQDLERLQLPQNTYDGVIYSDVIYYLDEKGKNSSLKWICDHLDANGVALIAAWCPGGKYLEYDELRRLVLRYLAIETESFLKTQHAVFIARKRRHLIAVTVDYETWHPIPPGKCIEWDRDIFRPTENLLHVCTRTNAKLTFFVEMGEYFWLKAYDMQKAVRMEEQWAAMVEAGHDVQLHIHPNWLPELGARQEKNTWIWDWSKLKLADYPGNLTEMIHRCKDALESVIRRIDNNYTVTSFRAGAYAAQPFYRTYGALTANGIYCDSSVYAGGYSADRGYDYTLAYSNHQPYYANPYDPQLKAPPAETNLIEIPIFTFKPNYRWFLDGIEGSRIAENLLGYLERQPQQWRTSEFIRLSKKTRRLLAALYCRLEPLHALLGRLIPKGLAHFFMTDYGSDSCRGNAYFLMVGHTKAQLDYGAIARNFALLSRDGRFEFLTLSAMASLASNELQAANSRNLKIEAEYQVRREYRAIMGDERNEKQSHFLQKLIPYDRKKLLDLGCGAGYWTARISQTYPWMLCYGLDYGYEFIVKANAYYASERVFFLVEDFHHLSFADETFDCVYSDNVLEHAYDVDRSLDEIYRVLRWGGVLVAAIPSDARNPSKSCENHNWKTFPKEVRLRLLRAGFKNIEIQEIDLLRRFAAPPYPPSDDKMMFIRAFRRKKEYSPLERALEAMDWVYNSLSPESSSRSIDPLRILSEGHAFCLGYAIVLGKLLQNEGFHVRWISMLAKNHPRGRGPAKIDSHEVLSIEIDGKEITLDPMANTCILFSLKDILAKPSLAVPKGDPDNRYSRQGYHLYDTEFWYSRVFKYAVRSNLMRRAFWKKWGEKQPEIVPTADGRKTFS